MEVCKEHLIVRYVLDGLGFEFPEDEQIAQSANPEINQTWHQYEQQFDFAESKLIEKDEAIDQINHYSKKDLKEIVKL